MDGKTNIIRWQDLNHKNDGIAFNQLPELHASSEPLQRNFGIDCIIWSVNLYGIKKKKKTRIKFAMLQRKKSAGGWGLSDFKIYHWSFVLHTIKSWFRPIKSHILVLFGSKANTSMQITGSNLYRYSYQTSQNTFWSRYWKCSGNWRLVTEYTNTNNKWHFHTPIFYNHNLLIGGRPAAYPIWSNMVHILGQLLNSNGLRTFEDLKEQYNLCRFSRFPSHVWPSL